VWVEASPPIPPRPRLTFCEVRRSGTLTYDSMTTPENLNQIRRGSMSPREANLAPTPIACNT
jgi:hypothetical protein